MARKTRVGWKSITIAKNVLQILLVLAIAFILPALSYYMGDLPLPARQTLFILSLAVGLWVTEAIPPFATALLVVGFQVFILGTENQRANDLALAKYTQAWSSPVIWLLMGGFCLSLALSNTNLDRIVFERFAKSFGDRCRRFLLGSMIVTAVLSMFMSNTASTALFLGILGPSINHPSQSAAVRKALLVGVPAAASIGGMATLIGSTPNAIAYNFIVQSGFDFGFFPWLMIGFPLLLLLVPLAWYWVIRFSQLPDERLQLRELTKDEGSSSPQLKRDQYIVLATFSLTVLLWATAAFHSLSVSVVSLIPIVILTTTGVIQSRDMRNLPWDTLLLIMGGMSLGESVIESGLAKAAVDQLQFVRDLAPYLIILSFAYLSVIFSTFVSNTAAAAILIPLGNAILGDRVIQLSLAIALASSIATALPVSTPPNAIAYASGYLKAQDFSKLGIVMALVSPPIITLLVIFLA